MRKLILILLSVLFLFSCAGPNSALEGYIKDSVTADGIGRASIEAYQGETLRASVESADAETLPIHGYYNISLSPGNYEIRIRHSDYLDSSGNNVTLTSGDTVTAQNWILTKAVCRDDDTDGFGMPAGPTCPKGEVADCNDSNAHIYPGGPELRVSGSQETFYPISSLQSVFSNTETGKTIQSKVGTFTGNLKIDQDKSIAIAGGYDCSFSSITGNTVVAGDVTVSDGVLTIDTGVLTIGP